MQVETSFTFNKCKQRLTKIFFIDPTISATTSIVKMWRSTGSPFP